MFAIPTLGGVRMSAYSAGGGIWDSPNRAEVFRRPPRWIRGSAGAGNARDRRRGVDERDGGSGDGNTLMVSGRIRGPRLAATTKVHLFEIVLEKGGGGGKPVYVPGEEVKGRVVIRCSGGLKLRSLSVTMKGAGRVHWTEYRARNNERYSAEVEYFKKKRYLIPHADAAIATSEGDRHTLADGLHEFEFRFHLPPSAAAAPSSSAGAPTDLPTSFEGSFGSVRYFVKADLDQSWAFTHRTKRAFTVISPIDINTQDLRAPVYAEADKTICCGVCTAGEVSMSVSADRKGYCPGEFVLLDASFSNLSSRRVVPEAVLCQTQTFSAGGKTRVRKSKFASLAGRAITAGAEEERWDALPLKIPAVTPTISNCGLIRVEYSIKVSLLIPGSPSLSVSLPIVVGTVPRSRRRRHLLPGGGISRQPSPLPRPRVQSTPEPEPQPDPAPPYDALDLPPSYTESIESAVGDLLERGDISHSSSFHGDTRFVPLYAYVVTPECPVEEPNSPPEYTENDPFPVQQDSDTPAS